MWDWLADLAFTLALWCGRQADRAARRPVPRKPLPMPRGHYVPEDDPKQAADYIARHW